MNGSTEAGAGRASLYALTISKKIIIIIIFFFSLYILRFFLFFFFIYIYIYFRGDNNSHASD